MMILRNKRLIPHDSSRGKSRNPVVCEGDVKLSPRDKKHLQATTEKTATVNQEGPVDYGNSNFASLGLVSSQGSTARTSSPSFLLSSTSFSSIRPPSFLPSSYERKCRVLPCKFLKGNSRCQTCSYIGDCKDTFTSTLTKRSYNFIYGNSNTL